MSTPTVAAFVHVHYPEIWAEMQETLAQRIGVPFHLVLTSSHPESEVVRPSAPNLLSTRFVQTENRGRDIRPFLAALHETPDFELGLKLHTKKSPQRMDGDVWRAAVLDALVPSPLGTAELVRRMHVDPRIGFVSPFPFGLSVKPWVLVNFPGMARVMHGLGHELQDADLEDAIFAAGSMFWFRRPALAAFAGDAILDLFEPEEAQLDGTTAHVMERLFPVEARRQGFVTLSTAALLEAEPGMPLPDLLALARQHADIPTTFFPAPYIAAVPPGSPLPDLTPPPPPPPPAPPPPPPPPPTGLQAAYHRLPLGLRVAVRRLLGRRV